MCFEGGGGGGAGAGACAPAFPGSKKKKNTGGGHHPTTKPARAAFTPFLTHLLPPPFPGAEQQAKLGESAQGFAATFKEEVRGRMDRAMGGRWERGRGGARLPRRSLSHTNTHALLTPLATVEEGAGRDCQAAGAAPAAAAMRDGGVGWVGGWVFFFSFVDERERGGNGAAPTRVGRAGLESRACACLYVWFFFVAEVEGGNQKGRDEMGGRERKTTADVTRAGGRAQPPSHSLSFFFSTRPVRRTAAHVQLLFAPHQRG